MKLEIYQDGKNQYGFRSVQNNYSQAYELRMIAANRPKSLLPVRFVEENDSFRLEYCISGLVAFSELDEEERCQNLYNLFLGMAEAGKDIYRLLLKTEALCLDPDEIFLRRETGRIQFAYNPENNSSRAENIAGLMEYIIKTTNPAREEDVLLIYGLYQKSRESNVTLFTLKEFWDGAMEKYRTDRKKPISESSFKEEKTGALSFSFQESIYKELGIDPVESEASLFEEILPVKKGAQEKPAIEWEEEALSYLPSEENPSVDSKRPPAIPPPGCIRSERKKRFSIGRRALFRALEILVALVFFTLALFFLFFR